MTPLISESLRAALLRNGATPEADHAPVVKLFDPTGAATWLLSEILPHNPDLLFGLCDLGMGYPELGYVSLTELESVTGRLGLGIERDLHFEGRFPLAIYAEAARRAGAITESEPLLRAAAASLAAHKRRDDRGS
jgi:Protein of unknown function (DUF2958)